MKEKIKKCLLIILSILIICATIYTCIKLVPLLNSLKDPTYQEEFKKQIEKSGIWGFLAILTIQILQVFIAFIPGEVVEIMAGVLYGSLGGLLLCLLGLLIATLLIYYIVKLFAYNYIDKYKEKLSTYSFLNSPKKIHIYFFIIFLIPGIPKDIFIYLVPFLPIKISTFLIVSLIARIPSIISSTIAGDSFIKGNYLLSIIVFAVFTLLGILAILFNDKIFSLLKKDHENNSKDIDTVEK